jgi:hypothetical protein
MWIKSWMACTSVSAEIQSFKIKTGGIFLALLVCFWNFPETTHNVITHFLFWRSFLDQPAKSFFVVVLCFCSGSFTLLFGKSLYVQYFAVIVRFVRLRRPRRSALVSEDCGRAQNHTQGRVEGNLWWVLGVHCGWSVWVCTHESADKV